MTNELEVGKVRSECVEALMKLEASQRVTVLQALIKMFAVRPSCRTCGTAIGDALLCGGCSSPPLDAA